MIENNQEKFEIRDLREKGRFIVDDKFINGYARFLDVYAVGVYNSLCRHADKKQKCYPSIKTIMQELSIGKNKVVDSIKYLEFWRIIKKQRLGLKLTNRYLLLSKRQWKPLNEENLKTFSEVYNINFKSLSRKLREFTTRTSIVRKHKRKETQKKGNYFSKEKKPYFWGKLMWKDENEKWWIIQGKDDFREFAGKETEIEWR